MNVTPIVNKGLSFDLKYYQELKTARSGAHFWYIDNGKLLRTKLAPFLPRMEYDATAGTVTASIVENGQELLSTSEAATPSLNNVPVSELQKLETLINELLAEASKDETPDNVKQLVNAFPLPKPNSMPECYRLYGNGPNKKLAIVWGLARKDSEGKEDVSSVVALKDFTYGLEYTPKKSYTWLWILLGIAAAGIAIYCTTDTKGSLTDSPTTAGNPPVEGPVVINDGPVEVLTPPEEQLPTPEKIEILKAKEATVTEEIAAIEAKQAELKEKLETMDQQSAEAKTAKEELADLLAKHEQLEKYRKAIQTCREELEKELPEVIETPKVPEVPVVLTPEEEQLPTPKKIEILKGKETAVQQEIDKVVKQQEELKAKIATMDQQSAEAKTAKEELDALQTKHGELEKYRKAIQTRREELEKELPDPVEVPVVLTPEEEQLPTPEKIEILKGKETAVQQEIDKVVKQQEELKAKIETMDQQSAEAKAARAELDALLAKHELLEKKRKAIQTRREELEKELPDPVEEPKVIIVGPEEELVVLTPKEEQLPTPEKIEILKGKETAVQQEIDEVVKQQEELKAKIATMDQQSDEAKTAKEELDALQTKHGELEKYRKAIQTRREELEKELPVVIETPKVPNVPTPTKIEILEKKEQDIRTEIKELEAEQKQLENELDAILARQKEQVEEYRQLKAMLEDSEKLAEKLDQSDLSDNERAELTQKKNELEMKINEAKQKLGTDTYLLNRERLNNIDARLKELDKESKQIIEERKTLKSAPAVTGIQPPDTKAPTPPDVIQKVVNVVINQSTDYKVTYVSNTPLAGTDQVLVKLNVSPIKPGLKFSKVTVESKEVDANGNVELEIQDSATQELQLKIWVDNQADPKYSAPIPVSTSVTE